MKINSKSKLSATATVVEFIRSLYKSIKIIIVFAASLIGSEHIDNILYIGLSVLIALLIAHSILYYLNFFYYITNNEFVIEKGYFNKTKISVPFDKIQSVTIKQNVIQQVLNIVELEIDSPGSNKKEISLKAMKRKDAEQLKSILMEKKDTLVDNDHIEIKEEVKIDSNDNNPELLFKLSPVDIIKYALSENILRGGLLVVSIAYGFYNTYAEYIRSYLDNILNTTYEKIANIGLFFGIILFIAFILFSITINIIIAFISNYDFTLYKNEKKFQLEKGIFTRTSQIIPKHKIQTYKWTTNPIKRLLGIYNINITQTNASKESKKNGSILIPACKDKIEYFLRNEIFPNNEKERYIVAKTYKRFFIRHIIFFMLLPLIGLFFININRYIILAYILWEILTAISIYLKERKLLARISENYLIKQSGILATSNTIVDINKIQGVKIVQTIFQKRRNAANIIVYTASEKIVIRYINFYKAKDMYTYILYKTETNKSL